MPILVFAVVLGGVSGLSVLHAEEETKGSRSQVAQDPTDAWMAYASNFAGAYGHGKGATEAQAKRNAVRACRRRSCKAVITVEDECSAYAENAAEGYAWGVGSGPTLEVAQEYALYWCGQYASRKTCKLRHGTCK